MDFQKELDAIYAGMFTDEMLDGLLAAFDRKMALEEFTATEDDYRAGKAALDSCLSGRQKHTLSDIEAASRRNLLRAMRFAFSRGLFAGFQTALVPGTPANQYIRLVADELLVMPNMLRYPAYSAERRHLRGLYDGLYSQLDGEALEHLVSVEVAWDQRLCGVLFLSFELGLNQALSIAGEVEKNAPVLYNRENETPEGQAND